MANSIPAMAEIKGNEVSEELPATAIQKEKIAFTLKENLPYALIASVVFIARLLTMPSFYEARDSLFFIRGIEKYSVLQMRPHWPGYPVYIWAGNYLNVFFSNPALSLHILSVLASTLIMVPLAALAFSWRKTMGGTLADARLAGYGAALLWAFVPLSWIDGSEIFSDPLALLMAVSLLWFAWKACQSSAYWLLLAAALGGFMLGVRLSYVALLLPLAYVTWLKRNTFSKKLFKIMPLFPLLVAVCFAVPVLLWFGWQYQMEGSKILDAGSQHLSGHYTEWGGSVTTDHNLLTRPVRFLETGLVYGTGSWWIGAPLQRLPVTVGMLALIGFGLWRTMRQKGSHLKVLFALWILPYFAWILLGNDVDLARYYFPFIAAACVFAAMGLPRSGLKGWGALAAIIAVLAVVTVPLAFDHQVNQPIGHKLTSYINSNLTSDESQILITDDVPYLIFFAQENLPDFTSTRVLAGDLDKEVNRLESQGQKVYATWLPGKAPAGWSPVARLCRNPYLESRGPLEVDLYVHGTGTNAVTAISCS